MKAKELLDKGHLLRAAENYGRAAEAARAFGADNLVTASMQLRQGGVFGAYSLYASAAADPGIFAGHRAECIALFSDAAEVLKRRRVADTLLDGKCAAAEEAWRAAEALRLNTNVPAAVTTCLVPLVGYEEILHAATSFLEVLARASSFASECSHAQFQSFARHAVHAAELMQLPRRHASVPMVHEADFTDALHQAVDLADVSGLDARLVQLLAGAWQRLQGSGVLQARHIEERIRLREPERRAQQAVIQKSMTAPGLRTCALPGCGAKEAHPTHFKSCAACRTVVYCCREHQVAGWPSHKKVCKAARKAAAAADDEAGPSGA